MEFLPLIALAAEIAVVFVPVIVAIVQMFRIR